MVRVIAGAIYDVSVDIRRDSPTYRRWTGVTLSSENKRMLYLSPWIAHGFCVLTNYAEVLYKTTQEYDPSSESGILWNDPELGKEWPIQDPMVSPRDNFWPSLPEANHAFTWDDVC